MASKFKKQMGLSIVLLSVMSVVIPTGAQAAGNSQGNNVAALYSDSCAACHDTGALGAPKTGDKATWQRLQSQKGMAKLVDSVKNGMPQMPAGGLCSDCSDTQYRQLIEYMANGAK